MIVIIRNLQNIFIVLNCITTYSVVAQIIPSQTVALKPSDCIQALEDNKYKFFFKTDYKLTDPTCALIYRESAFDISAVVFDGPFKDYRADGLLLVEGVYKNGYLDGKHTVKYLNGNTWQIGSYKNGMMTGTWQYFFPDGKPMYTIEIDVDKVFVKNVWDKDGKLIVTNGNGFATISYYKNDATTNVTNLSWKGEIKNGLIHGKWKQYQKDEATKLEEFYRNGMFIKGYENGNFFNIANFFSLGQNQPFFNAEVLQVADCSSIEAGNLPPTYPRGEEYLRKDLYNQMGKLAPDYASTVESTVTVSFEVGVDGELSNFNFKTNAGVEGLVKNAFIKLGPWQPAKQAHKAIAQEVTYTLEFYESNLKHKRYKHQALFNQNPHHIMNDPETKMTLNPPTYKAKD